MWHPKPGRKTAGSSFKPRSELELKVGSIILELVPMKRRAIVAGTHTGLRSPFTPRMSQAKTTPAPSRAYTQQGPVLANPLRRSVWLSPLSYPSWGRSPQRLSLHFFPFTPPSSPPCFRSPNRSPRERITLPTPLFFYWAELLSVTPRF